MRQGTIFAILLLLTGASFWILRDLEKSLETSEDDTEVREIAVAYQAKGRYYDANNQLKYEIDSDSVHEYSNGGGTKLLASDMRVLDENQQLAWKGHAQTTELSADRNVLDLSGDVQIIQSPTAANPIKANSERMTYYADKQEVIGDTPITVENGMMRQTAQRFKLDIAKDAVYFDGGVKGYYAPATQ